MLAEILNKLTTLRADYTAARAAFIDVAITSRAPSSTAVSNADLTPTRAGYLDIVNTNLDGKISEISDAPPKLGGLKGIVSTFASIEKMNDSFNMDSIGGEFTDTDTDVGVYKVLHAYTGAGWIELCMIYQKTNTSNKDLQAQLLIDGISVWGSAADAWRATGDNNDGYCVVGAVSDIGGSSQSVVFGRIPFSTSFSLEWKQVESGAVAITMGARMRYVATA